MANYFVGDIQGCFLELKLLLERVKFNTDNDILWVAGDMVARGPDSYQTILFLMSLGDAVKPVLGNHDLHLLATYEGIKKAKPQDKLDTLLNAADADRIMNWLACQPLLRKLPNQNVYMSHAGLSPQWTVKEAMSCADFAHKKLSGSNRYKWLNAMYGEQPNDWQLVKTSIEKFRFTVNALTRMRYVHQSGTLEFACKQTPAKAPKELIPWFSFPSEHLKKVHWIFGHWAALEGEVPVKNVYGLDTGCVWGGPLTMLRWDDKQYFHQKSLKN